MKGKRIKKNKSTFAKVIFISDEFASFDVEVYEEEYGNLIGKVNCIVSKELKCESDYKAYNGFSSGYLDLVESVCVERAKFIFGQA